MLDAVRSGFATVGDLIGRHRQRAAIAEAMRVVGEVNKYLTVTEPYKMKDESQRDRLATVLHVAAQCVSDCNTLLAPFLPARRQRGACSSSVARGSSCRCRASTRSTTSTPTQAPGAPSYPVITGDYTATPRWESRPVTVGAPVGKPTPVFTKLDPSVVDDELARMQA